MKPLQRSKKGRDDHENPDQQPVTHAMSANSHSNPYLIYRSPTVETLDGSLVSGRRDYYPSHNDPRTTDMDMTPLVKNTAKGPPASIHRPSPPVPPNPPQLANPRTIPRPSQGKQRTEPKQRRKRKEYQPRDFQIPQDIPRVEVRTINVAERSAFTPIRPPSVDEWKKIAQHAEQTRGISMKKRLSPSLQHLELLHKMQNVQTIQQLSFSPGLSLDADPWNAALEGGHDINRARSRSNKRDGRYRPIHPLKATMEVLPDTPPVLSHRKCRLPMRSDVGFPNPSPGEIDRKQNEIRLETQWEAASPRLIVLITSDDLGTTVEDDGNTLMKELNNPWNQGGWTGLPFAGRELIMAKEQNYDDFSKIPPQPKRIWKANPASMLAPPIDSTYSSTQDWKPRPFHDRSPGFTYVLTCPTRIELSAGNTEPLICSLALYTLPADGTKRNGVVYGKMSENFYLPAGDWERMVHMESALKSDGSIDQGMIDNWYRRKHKGIFSFDPKRCDKQSIHVVLQVSQVLKCNGFGLQTEDSGRETNADPMRVPELTMKKSIAGRIKSKLGKISKSSSNDKADTLPFDESISGSTYNEIGTKLLTPLCFGIVPLFSRASETRSQWPEGTSQEMNLYSLPANAESEVEFIDRLMLVSTESNPDVNDANNDDTFIKVDSAGVSTPSKRRLFKQARSVKSQHIQETRNADTRVWPTKIIGFATLFSSNLGIDFTQVMLMEPTILAGDDDNTRGRRVPRLLVDISGDCAIAMNPYHNDQLSTSSGIGSESSRNKRSNLIRLPKAQTPAGYADVSEVRELQYLPPRALKQYDVDAPSSFQSATNLLYLYPSVLKLSADIESQQSHVIRIRLMKTSVPNDDASGHMESIHHSLESFHNPAPWAGRRMLHEVYTKVSPRNIEAGINGKGDVLLRDEFKLRLPNIIDGTYFLEFTLYRINLNNNGTDNRIDMVPLSETIIPLSSASNREASSGVRITTIIPNGSHRLKLGAHQLQFETRLVSSIHICDPTTATTLRDFPFKEDDSEDTDFPARLKELSLIPSRSIVGKLHNTEPIVEIKIPFRQLFANASESTLLGHFPLFFHMHLSNLTNRFQYDFSLSDVLNKFGDDDGISVLTGIKCKGNFIVENLCSLFEVIRKVKKALLTIEGSDRDHTLLFAKEFVDRFDESVLFRDFMKIGQGVAVNFTNSSVSKNTKFDKVPETSGPHERELDEEIADDSTNGRAVRLKAKDSLRTEIDMRISKTISAMSIKDTPFSRVAYGATKTDRMRIEAELNQEGSKITHLMDDDETILSSLYNTKEYSTERGIIDTSMIKESNTWGVSDDETIIDGLSLNGGKSGSRNVKSAEGFGEIGESSILRRVRTAAQIMIAPCIAPSLATTLAHGSRRQDEEQPLARKVSITVTGRNVSNVDCSPCMPLLQPGSDSEEEGEERKGRTTATLSHSAALFRREAKYHYIALTISDLDKVEEITGAWCRQHSCAYEVILVLWAKAWLEYTAENGARIQHGLYHQCESETDNRSLLISSFYAHKDLLLPLCMKSMAMRCSSVPSEANSSAKVIVDEYHMQILEPVVEMLCQGLMAEALSPAADNPDQALIEALRSADTVVDFLIGLSSMIHPQQQGIIITTFIKTLRAAEKEDEDIFVGHIEWNSSTIRRVKSSRHLRLRAIEKLSVLASFMQSNFPLKYCQWDTPSKERRVSWNVQNTGDPKLIGIASCGSPYSDGAQRLPRSGWLACLLTDELLLICSLSCEAVVAEAIAHTEVTKRHFEESQLSLQSALQQRPGKMLTRCDLLLLQSLGVHAITCLYELLLRRHAMDTRFQSDQCQGRIAATFAPSILTKSIDSVRWLARMESTHKVRSVWLLCFIYILQEAPEGLMRTRLRSYCYPPDFSVHRFIRLLRLCSSTFQCMVDETKNNQETSAESSINLLPWLLQESFNTVCATVTLLVDECTISISSYPREQKKMAQGVLDLLLHILTIPQSAVTHLRSVGAALHSLTKFGISVFLDVVGDSLQHWIRVILTLMNSISLSVRSISVDFVISLLGETYKGKGNIDEVSTTIATVLPEIIAREIALYSISDLIEDMDQIENCVWPLRRAFADVEDANPLDDNRVDPQLSPLLSVLCRSCQAIMDGVLIELRLMGDNIAVVGTRLDSFRKSSSYTFDADEESLFEAASFFASETATIQKLRWFQTLIALHKSKGQWLEAAETLMLCGKTISDSIPHLRNVWRPSEFVLWHDDRRSLWLGAIGKNIGLPHRGNMQVMEFAGGFLEPTTLFGESSKKSTASRFAQTTLSSMCSMLTKVTKEAVAIYLQEGGMDELAFSRLETLLRVVMSVVEDHSALSMDRSIILGMANRQRMAEEAALLRQVSAILNADLTRLAERLALVTEIDNGCLTDESPRTAYELARNTAYSRQYYVRVIFSGIKPERFTERTTIPTFFDWDNACISRVPKHVVESAISSQSGEKIEVEICNAFAKPLLSALGKSVVFRNAEIFGDLNETVGSTFLDISLVYMDIAGLDGDGVRGGVLESKRFFHRKSNASFQLSNGFRLPQLLRGVATNLVELTVVNQFPCPLSRQRSLITSEFIEESA